MKEILSIFDHSGTWSAPYWNAGHNVWALDKQNDLGPVDANDFSVEYFFEELGVEWVDAIIAAPPCTDFTNSGARWWKNKDKNGQTAMSTELVYQVLRSVNFWQPDWWVLENPVGRIHKCVPELGKPAMYFDPCDYAGWVTTAEESARLDELRTFYERNIPFTIEDIELIRHTGAYTKKTALWGSFNIPEKRRIEPVRVCSQGSWLQRLGGASERTKNARSETPSGFSMAFFESNSWNRWKQCA